MKIIENIEKKEKGIIKKINSENKKCVIWWKLRVIFLILIYLKLDFIKL